jgi:predicted transposase YbfD/YdcC
LTTDHPDHGVVGIRRLVDMLAGVTDPRQARGVRHRVGTVLTVMVLAVLAGARNFREIADRATELPPPVLALAGCRVHPATGLPVTPSKATIRRIAHAIDADAADQQVSAWLRAEAMTATIAGDANHATPEGLIAVAMDGKTVRNTCLPGTEGTEIKLFSALTHTEAVVIAQVRIPQDTNEITQVTALLTGVDLTGVVVTGDAAHAQHATAAYLAGLRAQIAAAVPPAVPGTEHHVSEDRSHGRIVRRAIWVAPAEGIEFPGAAQVFQIRRDTFDHAGHWLSKEIVYGVTSLAADQATPDDLARLIRTHWTVENKSHWVRDVVYREDHQYAYAGTGAQVMATVRNLALGLLRLAGITEITRTVQRIAADRRLIFSVIGAATSRNRL